MTGRRPTRATETRDNEIREVLDNLEHSQLDIPERDIPDDMEYAWCRKTVAGYEDEGNLTEKSRLGWKSVPAERHPEIGNNDSIFNRAEDRQGHVKGYIEYRGLILCERPKKIGEAIRRRMEMQNVEVMQSTPGMGALSTGYVRENRLTRASEAGFQE